jgi:hypothetical protein
MALESLPKIAPALFSAEQDLIQIYNKKTDTFGVVNASLLGGSTPPSGVSGAIQFSTGSAFGSDSANLFWDNTTKRLGIGTNSPSAPLDVNGTADGVTAIRFKSQFSAFGTLWSDNTQVGICRNFRNTGGNACLSLGAVGVGVRTGGDHTAVATLDIKGSGSTSATTSLLVQNGAGSEAFRVYDDRTAVFSKEVGINTAPVSQNALTVQAIATGRDVLRLNNTAGTLIAEYYVDGSNNGEMYVRNSVGTTRVLLTSSGNASYFVDALAVGASSANASAILDATSTTKGFLPPRMTTTQKNAIASPANGLIVFDTDLQNICYRRDGVWVQVSYTAA